MKKINIFLTTATMILILFASCKNDPVATPPRTDIHLDSNAQVGRYLVDKDGKTLYYFSNDANGLSNCTGGCLTNWPIFYADSATTTFSDGLLSSDFKTITNASSAKQTTYKGWPLYYYSPAGVQEAAGQTTGEGVGNVWFVAKSNYSIMIANYQLTGNDGVNYLSTYAPGDGRTNYFSDGNGNTLYAFARDSSLLNKFTKPDFSNNPSWPMYETDNITVPSTLDKSLFVVTDFNGKKQLTYKGWPLYYFGPDNNVRGSNKGITIPPTLPAGSIWPVVVKDAVAAPTP
jgi:predicted lipoprotein with Yx(FWY)xxD motif